MFDPEVMTLTRLDGADFGSSGGVRSERCRSIVIDEQRSHGPKSARPGGVALCSPVDSVATLAGATSPCCAPRLATGLHSAIKVDQSHVFRV
jgi:hypothetical protein